MSLTANDLSQIRVVVTDVVDVAIDSERLRVVVTDVVETAIDRLAETRIKPIENEVRAIRNDIKELYDLSLRSTYE